MRQAPLRQTTGIAEHPVAKRRDTGQPAEDLLGLYFYRARWYDPTLGRFIQADTIVPGMGDPLASDRYAYVKNNPVKYTDELGTCWGPFSGARSLPSYDVTCGNLDLAYIILYGSQASFGEQVLAGGYIAAETGAHATPVVVAGVLTCVYAVAGCAEAIVAVGDTVKEFVGSVMETGDVDLAEDASDLLPGPVPTPGNEASQPPEYPLAPEGSKGPSKSPLAFPPDPNVAPAEGLRWRTESDDPGPPGSREGNWWKKATGDWLHWEPDSPSHGPHWDYRDPWARRYRIFPDGTMRPKLSLGAYRVD